MSSLTATTTFAVPDPGVKFTTQAAQMTLQNNLVTTTINGDVTTYVLSSTTPAVEDQDKIWYRLNANGGPNGWYTFYKGLWVRTPPLPANRIQIYYGDPTTDFDGTGKGLAGSGPVAKDFMGWAIANGQNGTANFSDRFIIGARMDNVDITGWDAGTQTWRTNIQGVSEASGGASTITTNVNTTYRPAAQKITVGLWDATDGQARHTNGALYGLSSGDDSFNTDLNIADVGNLTPNPISVVNPFYAVAYLGWIGYDVY